MTLHGERLDRPTYDFLRSDVGDVSGASGEVRLAEHNIFGTLVVQKTISLLGVVDGIARSEPAILKSLDHPHLIKVHEAQWTPKRARSLECVTFTADYYEGRCVNTALTEGHVFGVGGTLDVIEGVLSGLTYLHDTKSLLHRDIKPGNILLNGSRRHAYIGDLGSAAELDPTRRTTDAYGGTPLYRSPEAASGVLDVRSDLYGVGAVMVEMLNGQYDYPSINRDKIDERLRAVDERSSARAESLVDREYMPAPWVPGPVAALVRKLVAVDPDARFASAHEALRALRRVRCVTWARTDGVGLTGSWEGTFPNHVAAGRVRTHEVTAAPVMGGRYAGKVKLTARWRRHGALDWRGYAELTRWADAGDARALAAFFRAVEAKAQSAQTV